MIRAVMTVMRRKTMSDNARTLSPTAWATLPVLRFDGSDDRLALNWSLNAPLDGVSV